MSNNMIRIEDKRKQVSWVNKDHIIGVIEEKTNSGSIIVLDGGLQIHLSEKPDYVMMHIIGT